MAAWIWWQSKKYAEFRCYTSNLHLIAEIKAKYEQERTNEIYHFSSLKYRQHSTTLHTFGFPILCFRIISDYISMLKTKASQQPKQYTIQKYTKQKKINKKQAQKTTNERMNEQTNK